MFNNRVFISSDFLAPPWARKFFLVGAQISSLKLTLQRYDAAIAVLECRRKKNRFLKLFCTENVDGNLLLSSAFAVSVLQCYSSRKAFPYPKNTSIFTYKYRVYFWLSTIVFGTVTL